MNGFSMEDHDKPVTRRQLHEEVSAMETRLADLLTERMRDMQSELLRGFERFSTGFTLHGRSH